MSRRTLLLVNSHRREGLVTDQRFGLPWWSNYFNAMFGDTSMESYQTLPGWQHHCTTTPFSLFKMSGTLEGSQEAVINRPSRARLFRRVSSRGCREEMATHQNSSKDELLGPSPFSMKPVGRPPQQRASPWSLIGGTGFTRMVTG